VLRNFERIHAETGIRFRADASSRCAITGSRKRASDHYVFDLTQEKRWTFARDLAEIASGRGISLYTCCGNDLIQDAEPRIHKAHCVDRDLVSELVGTEIIGKPNPTREGCGCWESRDIGAYDTCPHGCMYCYANVNKNTALLRHRRIAGHPNAFALGCPADRSEFPPLKGRG
jgi:hypothetical protein